MTRSDLKRLRKLEGETEFQHRVIFVTVSDDECVEEAFKKAGGRPGDGRFVVRYGCRGGQRRNET